MTLGYTLCRNTVKNAHRGRRTGGKRLKQFLAVLEALVTVVLVLVAIAGISYRAFRDGGWLSQGIGKLSDAYMNYPLIAISVTVAAFFAVRAWRSRDIRGSRHRYFDYLIYVLMAVGIYFIGHYALTGDY